MPQALALFGKSQPGRFFAGPTLALDVGGSTASLAGHANPDELASFLHFCGCRAVVLDEAECPPPTGWARAKSLFVFGLAPGKQLPEPAVEETLWASLHFDPEPPAGPVAQMLFPDRPTRRADFYSELCSKRARGRAVVWALEQGAVRLAERYGADVTKARIAALLHDCTKKLDMDEQLALCKKYHIPLDELERKALKLLHSKTGAAIARDVFAVDDDVYNAIMYHTTGKPDMTLLEKIIYLADYIEPTRDFPGVEALRRTVYEDLDRGLLMGLTMTIDEMEEMGNPVHHMTRDARDYLMKRGIS